MLFGKCLHFVSRNVDDRPPGRDLICFTLTIAKGDANQRSHTHFFLLKKGFRNPSKGLERMAMNEAADAVENATSKLLKLNEQDLYLELGKRLYAVRRDPKLSASLDLSELGIETYGIAGDIADFGKRFLKRVNEQAFALVCGPDATDVQERQELTKAFGLGSEAVAGVLASLFIAQLGLAPAIAVAVAPIIVKLVFGPTHAAMCETWRAKMAGQKA
jgi:hypothetical protein